MRVMRGMLHTGNGMLTLDFCKLYRCCIGKCVRLVLGSDENARDLTSLACLFRAKPIARQQLISCIVMPIRQISQLLTD